jgi:hypothetical protein
MNLQVMNMYIRMRISYDNDARFCVQFQLLSVGLERSTKTTGNTSMLCDVEWSKYQYVMRCRMIKIPVCYAM